MASERISLESTDSDSFWEHIYRYQFAASFVKGARVLDAACGEGYGSAGLLAAGASKLIAIDVSEDACKTAREKYGIEALIGDVTRLPLPDSSVDVVVSFETIEHLENPNTFISECRRVLTSNGTLIISTPDLKVRRPDVNNPYHISEMPESEFFALISKSFRDVKRHYQRALSFHPWSPLMFSGKNFAWRKVRGFHWLQKLIVRGSCPNLSITATKLARKNHVEAITKPTSSWKDQLFNPYLVRDRSFFHGERPVVHIAVATV